MSQLNNLSIEELIEPITDEAVTGEDPRSDISPTSTYYLLKDVRSTARANERKALIDEEDVLSVAIEWRPIFEQVPDITRDKAKDLEYIAWFIEAACRLHGFKGLSFGFTLAAELIERYWENLYPIPDPDDLEERIAPLIGLNGVESEGSLIQPIKTIPITEGAFAYSTWQYEQALEVDRLDSDKQEKRFDAGAISLEEVELSIKETSDSFFIELDADVNAAIAAFSRLSEVMDTAMGGLPQPTSYIRKALEACALQIHTITEPILAKSQTSSISTEVEVETDDELTVQSSSTGIEQQLNSRAQAIDNLEKIAEFFKNTEPHSPMSYAIEQVIRWSDLSLPELLQELIQDGEARNGFFKLSGIKTEE
ncbi:type VI secretion protein [Shewanella sp. UCD-FRSSP16_17]|uniref:type VI secretion system protein TssA n=1 Tax=Shewanella sp. UCD-FRSSP16_17 TaxID=1853256 RepID=UPI0007EED8D1|nr:type VI secretion system protein TssA [Shewanella sp. UCD-FRSSP16_17]OBT11142.1 type VI secretion protein [Shewanella sp. UCD-FRSSP16_17]